MPDGNQTTERRLRVLSWNVLRRCGATPGEVAAWVHAEAVDLVLLQEADDTFRSLSALLGGEYQGRAFDGGPDGLGAWSRAGLQDVRWLDLEMPDNGPKMRRKRRAMVITANGTKVANVHLSHGQMLARRQFAQAAGAIGEQGAVVGDYNMVGPVWVDGWMDAGPSTWTHLAKGLVPLRLDRCLVRGMQCDAPRALRRGSSDHRPIVFDLIPIHHEHRTTAR